MNIEEYLANAGIKEECNFMDLIRANLLPEDHQTYILLLEESRENPEKAPGIFRKMYAFMAEHDLFGKFWNVNTGHVLNNTPIITENIQGQNVLDIGCSDGLKTIYYALKFPDKYFLGIDLCKGAVHLAQKKADKTGLKNVKFAAADVFYPCVKPIFDTVIATQVLHEMYSSEGYFFNQQFKSISDILVPKGKAIITLLVWNKEKIKKEIQEAACSASLNLKDTVEKEYSYNGYESIALNFIIEK